MPTYQRWSNRTNRCEWCHQLFDCSRYDAIYCSTKCRVAHKRSLARVEALKIKALAAVEELGKYRNSEGTGDALKALNEIERRAHGLTLLLED